MVCECVCVTDCAFSLLCVLMFLIHACSWGRVVGMLVVRLRDACEVRPCDPCFCVSRVSLVCVSRLPCPVRACVLSVVEICEAPPGVFLPVPFPQRVTFPTLQA